MKLGIISDIHGDFEALELAWAHLTSLGAERIVCAGDLVGYGPLPDQVVAFLDEHGIPSARGNHDRWAIGRGPGRADEFGGGVPSIETIRCLSRLPFHLEVEAGGRVGVVVHGSPRSDMEYIQRDTHPPDVLRACLNTLKADFLVVGHTHAPMWYRGDCGLVINPGSVISAPVVSTSRTFALLETDDLGVTFYDVESGRPVEVTSWAEDSD